MKRSACAWGQMIISPNLFAAAVARTCRAVSGADINDNSGSEGLITIGNLSMDPDRHSCTWKGMDVKLTVTEFMILEALARRPGVVKNRDQLLDAAYGETTYLDDRTIDSHIKRLRRKFRETDQEFDLIETLYGVGYKYVDR